MPQSAQDVIARALDPAAFLMEAVQDQYQEDWEQLRLDAAKKARDILAALDAAGIAVVPKAITPEIGHALGGQPALRRLFLHPSEGAA